MMVHKSVVIPSVSKFIDESILSHYPPTSMKRILMAGGISLYLKRNSDMVDQLLKNPMFSGLGVSTPDGMIDVECLKDVLKEEIRKAGFMRITFPIVGDVDFTVDDVETLYKYMTQIDTSISTPPTNNPAITGVY